MNSILKDFFKSEHIEYYSAIPISYCKIQKKYLLEKQNIPETGSVLIFLAPYYTGFPERNLSIYAAPMDYHIYFQNLFSRITDVLKLIFSPHSNGFNYSFHGFADHSPIDEVHAAASARLGFIGDNRMLINEKYSSFVFIGSIFSDMPADLYGDIFNLTGEVKQCLHCGKCKEICPDSKNCLSSVTQKKGELTEFEINLIVNHKSIWGCDLCQIVCPMFIPHMTEIEFFKQNLIYNLTEEILDSMSDEEFSTRAYSWRGRKTIARNITFFKNLK